MTETDKFNDIYLSLEIRKSQEEKTDEYGNYYFEVEASNENVDLQDQVVLQNALMESKDEFLRGGVISFDHLHKRKDAKGNIISDPSMVIGEPVDVKFDPKTKSTVVIGKLYATNEKAKEIIKMLKAGSTRVRASVGGIFPEVVKNLKTGVEKITHVLWNDLALTTSPVNNTVGSAVFAKSMSAVEFVNYLPLEMKKSLCAGYGTDSSNMTGGRALIPEDTNTNTIEADNTISDSENEIIKGMCELLKDGELSGEEAAINYLIENGIEKDKAGDIIREIITQGGEKMKKSFSNSVSALLKSLTGGNQNEEDEDINKGCGMNKSDNENDDENDIDIEDEDNEDEDDEDIDNDDDTDDDDDNGGEEDNETDNDDEEVVDGSEVLKSLDYELTAMRKSMRALRKQNEDLGEAVTSLAQMVYAIGSEKLPPKSVLNKSNTRGNTMQKSNVQQQTERPTEDDLYRAQLVLAKAVEEGTIDMRKSSMISSDLQKCMYTGKPMKPEYYEFLQKELAKGAK